MKAAKILEQLRAVQKDAAELAAKEPSFIIAARKIAHAGDLVEGWANGQTAEPKPQQRAR